MQRSVGTKDRVETNGWTDGRYRLLYHPGTHRLTRSVNSSVSITLTFGGVKTCEEYTCTARRQEKSDVERAADVVVDELDHSAGPADVEAVQQREAAVGHHGVAGEQRQPERR